MAFLQKERILSVLTQISPTSIVIGASIGAPILFQMYSGSLEYYTLAYCFLGCGFGQGIINHYMYLISDNYLADGKIDMQEWKRTKYYDLATFNSDITYLYVLGSVTYTSFAAVPEVIRWTWIYPGVNSCLLQILLISVLHDLNFYAVHYLVHRVKPWRISHLELHHGCPLHIGSSRCAVSSDSVESLVRDLLTLVFATYTLKIININFYGHLWIAYYTLYSLWAFHSHTGNDIYHSLHHSNRPDRNYGLYGLSDYLAGTLDLKNYTTNTEKIK